MTTWDNARQTNQWQRDGLVHWTDSDTSTPIAYLSVVFSWSMQKAREQARWYRQRGYHVIAGGPAAYMQPDKLLDLCTIGPPGHPAGRDAVARHNPHATTTTRGCIRRCHFCIVSKIEPVFKELDTWPIRPLVIDNNIVASSKPHFNKMIDSFKGLKGMDFNSGIDVRLLTKFHAERLAELDHKVIRLAWDNTRSEKHFMRAFQTLIHAGFPVRIMNVYVLIGYTDTPDDALYRLSKVRGMGARPFPCRFQPLDSDVKNQHVGKHWTAAELKRYQRYWANLSRTGSIPFEEFAHRGQEPPKDARIRSL